MDKITISDLIVHTVIGVHSCEQNITQPLTVELSFFVDIARAAKHDLLCDTQDYAAICAAITDFANNSRHRLLETFSKNLSDHLRKQFQISIAHLAVTKRPADLPGVSVTLEGSAAE